MIRNNPFLSESFTAIWSEHFNQRKSEHTFRFLPAVRFIKHRFLPMFTNIGKTFTKGIDYSLALGTTEDFKKKVFLIYDVPTYFDIDTSTSATNLKLYRTKQYPGYLVKLENYTELSDYMLSSFSKSSRYKLKKYKKRFEACFDVRYVMYRGEISKEDYDFIFDSFRHLLKKRFEDKQITNNNLDPKEWQFYYEVTYPMLLEKKASLFVIYNDEIPIGVTLNFFSETILFDAITVFDIDYSKFHLGSVTIMKLLEWCLEQKLKIFDFSKGYFDYKTRWADHTYDFEYHIYYDASSIRSKGIAFSLKNFYNLKQTLREKKINERWHRITYRLKNRSNSPVKVNRYSFSPLNATDQIDSSIEIDLNKPENHSIKLMVFEFLYLNDECYNSIKVYGILKKASQYYLIGKTKKAMATLQ